MKEQEFRTGNLVEYDGRIFEIDTIAKEFPTLNTIEFGIGVVGWSNIKRIPLTEEWLLNFGFDVNTDYASESNVWYDYKKNNVRINLPYFTFSIENGESEIEIKYVHQLQNLYFALTGEELTIKN